MNVAAPVRQKDVADLCRTDTVENVESSVSAPAFENRRRERFAGADACTDRLKIRRYAVVDRCKHVRVCGGHTEEQRWTMFAHNIKDGSWTGTPGKQHGRSANMKRKVLRVAEAIGEEEFGD